MSLSEQLAGMRVQSIANKDTEAVKIVLEDIDNLSRTGIVDRVFNDAQKLKDLC